MNDKLARYLMIDAQDVTKTIYKEEKEFFSNDFWTYYREEDILLANNIFKKNHVPNKYRKIIIKLDSIMPLCFLRHGNEYISNASFDLYNQKKGNEKVIQGCYWPNTNSVFMCYLSEQNTFKASRKVVSYKTVIEFLDELKKSNYLYSYVKSIGEILDLKEHQNNFVPKEKVKVLTEKLEK